MQYIVIFVINIWLSSINIYKYIHHDKEYIFLKNYYGSIRTLAIFQI